MSDKIIEVINTFMLCYAVAVCYTQSVSDFLEKNYKTAIKLFLYGTGIIGFYSWYSLLYGDNPPTPFNVFILTTVFSTAYYVFVCMMIGLFYAIEAIVRKLKSLKK